VLDFFHFPWIGLLLEVGLWHHPGLYDSYKRWATVNFAVATILWNWIVVPFCYYTNPWHAPILESKYQFRDGTPFGSLNNNKMFNSSGQRIYVRRPNLDIPNPVTDYSSILNQDFTLNEDMYNQQGPFFITDFFTIGYFTSFINISTGYIMFYY
jgi:hypothetical protein